ncbi:SDR family NAD(P)-dependent oxidoreductase [Pseudolysinimonas kribbensis]|uniref:Short-chain dehydrogenase n=1 Tax=Pseudolysinimonas kribbensis TaxID=433641 RepID=A0ABQ6K786_9MICO|nr:SDR family NAD(P)-dependent oxidoreductase [Pseudolysinimonas kribbensis]GMA94840.1 short-chain dehydrogenase [Pseudolysinimonas kribbensis]
MGIPVGTALVTGGTSGIGAAFARALAKRGHDIVLVARSAGPLEAMAAELRALGSHVETITADLSDRADTSRVAERLRDTGRPIDVLVNNAGFGLRTRLVTPDVAEHERAFDVMIRAVFVLGAAAAEQMRGRGRGAIINVGSVSGETSMNAYSAIKAWVNTYSEVLANELHGTGVTVTDLEPGWVHTQFHQRAELRSSSIPGFLWLDADYLVERCLRDADRGKVISIPSVRFKVLTWFTRHLPSTSMRAVSRRIALRRRDTVSQ